MAGASPRLYQKVVDALAASIRSGEFAPGGKLPGERELADRFGVSRPTIREAMIALEIHGLVEIRHGSGITVLDAAPAREAGDGLPTEDLNVGAFEILEARLVVEGGVAALAASVATEEDVQVLTGLLGEMTHSDVAVSAEADRQFHLHLARMTGNGPLLDTVETLWQLRSRSRLASIIEHRAEGSGREARALEHEQIIEAMRLRDPAAARQAMHSHLERVRQHLLDATETEEMESLLERQRANRSALSRRSVF